MHPSRRIGLDLEGIGGRMAATWSTLPQYVRSGRSAYATVFGRPFWEDLDANPDVGASFDALMGPIGHGTPDPSLLLADDWDSVRSVVDVGGGTGPLLAEILRAHPGVHGTLVDLPRTVARAADVFKAAGVDDRAQVVGQSFFDPLPAGADLYLVVKVLNDWPDADVARIVARLAAAARPNGRVVISGGVAADAASPALGIDMLMAGGKTRSLAVFREIAAANGLDVVAAGHHPRTARYLVECRPRAA
jgi:SAM-dependent methyltransferase